MKKVFIDGSEGTTGLRIFERFQVRDDIELLKIDSDKRKDPEEIKKFINASDITFLCLPDAAAREAVALCDNPDTVILDTSTAHRTEAGWAYGFPELSAEHRQAIAKGKRIAVPGCYASGFIGLAYPLVKGGILPKDYPVSIFAVSGYSGGGKKLIAAYEEEGREAKFDSARMYAWTQSHKHLKEMKAITGIDREPLFSPMTTNYHSGMIVQVPLFTDLLSKKMAPEEIWEYLAEYYKDEKFIKVMPFGADVEAGGALFSDACAGWDGMEIFVTGNADRVIVASRFDNLGKGASGAAIQCMNIVLGCDE
ncbi:MAG: N-acetyl-gamma-glutamyl-phosphate reductase, partial [Lachnospiraceae bacterium]|nr:N-acetyl-gamma-glutamyl-phosphate reductase [Lachnospiraceae bacterium]